MSNRTPESDSRDANGPGAEPGGVAHVATSHVQCPNCCRLAPVTSRSMGLLFYKCELCETFGATPDPHHTA